MNMTRQYHWLCAILAAALLIAVSPEPTESQRDTDPEGAVPHPSEVALFEELSNWRDAPELSPDPTPGLVIESEMYRRRSSASAQRRFLATLPFGADIAVVADEAHIDGLLIAAMVEAESRFDPGAVSPRGALGLMQVMPSTARDLGADLSIPAENLRAGAEYVAKLLERYDGDLRLSLAAYNAGPGNVRRFGGVPPYRETLNYVERVVVRYHDHLRQVWQAEGFHMPSEAGQVVSGGG